MNIGYTGEFIRNLRKLSLRNKKLREIVVEKINLFVVNRTHPSLRLHKLRGQLKDAWSISINKSVRIIIHISNDEISFVDIGSHDEVYK